jgi:hypothetical protein
MRRSVAEPCDRAGCATVISDTGSGHLKGASWWGSGGCRRNARFRTDHGPRYEAVRVDLILKRNHPRSNGLCRTKESRAWPGRPDSHPSWRPRPWGSYQQNAGNRCANRRFRRSRPTVRVEVMCSHRVQLYMCSRPSPRSRAPRPPLPCYSTPRIRLTRRATASRRRAVWRARSEGSRPRPVPWGRCRCTGATVGGVGRGSARPAV